MMFAYFFALPGIGPLAFLALSFVSSYNHEYEAKIGIHAGHVQVVLHHQDVTREVSDFQEHAPISDGALACLEFVSEKNCGDHVVCFGEDHLISPAVAMKLNFARVPGFALESNVSFFSPVWPKNLKTTLLEQATANDMTRMICLRTTVLLI
jgi:hypothetical protein